MDGRYEGNQQGKKCERDVNNRDSMQTSRSQTHTHLVHTEVYVEEIQLLYFNVPFSSFRSVHKLSLKIRE